MRLFKHTSDHLNEVNGTEDKGAFIGILRLIVGPEFGYIGEGNSQWYYIVALAISVMLSWMSDPKIAVPFTIFQGLHLASVIFYACTITQDSAPFKSKRYFVTTMAYCVLHIVIFTVAMTISIKYALIFTGIAVLLYEMAPDELGNNIFYRDKDMTSSSIPLVFNCIVFLMLVAVTINLHVIWYGKLLIIIGFIILHVIVDYLEGECIIIKDVNSDIATFFQDMYYTYSKGVERLPEEKSSAKPEAQDDDDDDDAGDETEDQEVITPKAKPAKKEAHEKKVKSKTGPKDPKNPYSVNTNMLDGEDDDSDEVEEPGEPYE